MRRLIKRWVGLLIFVLVLGIAFINLGEWQLRRLDQRRAENAVIVANQNREPIPYSEIADQPVTEDDEWQRVTVRGTFDTENQFQVRYRTNDEVPGYEVVTPLRTTDGDVVLVDRGFFAVGRGAQIPTTPPPAPSGEVEITAHLRETERGKPKATDPVDGMVRLISVPALEAALPYEINDGYLGVLEIDSAQEGDPVPIMVPPLDEGPHFWYAMQWFLFAGIAVLGLVVFIRGDLKGRQGPGQRCAGDVRRGFGHDGPGRNGSGPDGSRHGGQPRADPVDHQLTQRKASSWI